MARRQHGAVVEQPGHQRRLLEADHAELGAHDVRRRRAGLGQRRQLDPARRSAMAERARSRPPETTWDHVLQRCDEAYAAALARVAP